MKFDYAVCKSVRAVGVLLTHPVGWLEVFLQATETCPDSEKFATRQSQVHKQVIGPIVLTA